MDTVVGVAVVGAKGAILVLEYRLGVQIGKIIGYGQVAHPPVGTVDLSVGQHRAGIQHGENGLKHHDGVGRSIRDGLDQLAVAIFEFGFGQIRNAPVRAKRDDQNHLQSRAGSFG